MLVKPLKVIISGGGTGGHIFPAVAIANALKLLHQNVDILFVGAQGRMEMEKVPAAGYNIEGLWISGFQRKLSMANISFPLKVISSLIKARKIFEKFKPDVAVGTGGYASGPMLRVAAQKGIPTVIQEQNSYPGITNRLLAKKVSTICVAYDGMERYFPKEKIILTGNPVRQDILNLDGKRERGMEFFGLSLDKKTVLIIGGSLGAKTINESISGFLEDFIKADMQVLWQTGKTFFPIAQEILKKHGGGNIKAYDFIARMDYAYAVADVVVSRAGAISISELCLAKKPSILIPSPNVAEDHQTKNAMALVTHNAAIIVKDIEAREKLFSVIVNLMNDENQRSKLQNNIARLAFKDSANVIANEVLRLINKNKN